MSDEKVTRVKLYTFAEIKDVLAQVIADMVTDSSHNGDYDDPYKVALMEVAVGGKIMTELDKKHEKGEL